jgi:hypothetical protein
MDNVTLTRIIAGAVCIILTGILIARRKRMASTRRVNSRR